MARGASQRQIRDWARRALRRKLQEAAAQGIDAALLRDGRRLCGAAVRIESDRAVIFWPRVSRASNGETFARLSWMVRDNASAIYPELQAWKEAT